MRLAVIGAGGVGGYFGAKLLAGGNDVVFTARGAHLDAMHRSGLRVAAPEGPLAVPPGCCTETDGDLHDPDIVLFCVKSYDTARTAASLASRLRQGTVVVSLQNGVHNEEALRRALPCCAIFGGVAYIYSTITRPGEITVGTGPRRIVFAPFGDSSPVLHHQAECLLDACRRSGVGAEISPDITVDLWKKFIFITGAGGLTALTRLTLAEILAVDATRELLADAMRETLAVALAQRIDVGAGFLDGVFATLARFDNATRSSLYYDLVNGKPMELEALPGTVVRLGAQCGVPTPVNRAIYAALLPYHIHNSEKRR
ncbi:MAG TPA: 2-dehydropantoate 2-reductase [Bacteroidota bacterium]|nr:2-dehydropantoate 2-reductase [Bacteroidota bacterium]